MQNSVIKNATEKLKCNSIYDFGEQQQQQKKNRKVGIEVQTMHWLTRKYISK